MVVTRATASSPMGTSFGGLTANGLAVWIFVSLLAAVGAADVGDVAAGTCQNPDTCGSDAGGGNESWRNREGWSAELENILNIEPNWRLDHFGTVSDTKGSLARTFMSSAHRRAATMLEAWMEDAGMESWVDGVGNVHGKLASKDPNAKTLLMGSHFDTVLDAGRFDGAMGIICGISAVKALNEHLIATGQELKHSVQVVAFADEEGVRFQSTFLGSRAIAGTLIKHGMLKSTDKDGKTLAEVLEAGGYSGSEEEVAKVAIDPKEMLGYVEVHMEQGPQLEKLALPLGVVSAIAGQTRVSVSMFGEQGHAGTVPMEIRLDPVAAAAEAVHFIERRCTEGGGGLGSGSGAGSGAGGDDLPIDETDPSHRGRAWGGEHEERSSGRDFDRSRMLVCTVGSLTIWPGASNVIAGSTNFTIDMRSRSDLVRSSAVDDIVAAVRALCDRRGMRCDIFRTHDAEAVECDKGITDGLVEASQAVTKVSYGGSAEAPVLVSGAGHDALAMADVTRVGMIFVRCRAGVSHSPLEHVPPEDVRDATHALYLFMLNKLM